MNEDEPIVGVKAARLVSVDRRVFFAPCFPRATSEPYTAVAFAVCEAGHDHRAPGTRCRCGFHAVKAPVDLWRLEPGREVVRLDVELAGTVVEHEYGWRASYQAVLGVHLPAICTRARCERPTAGVAPYRLASYDFELTPWVSLRPVCERCGRRRLIRVPEIAGQLGVEVSVEVDAPALPPEGDQAGREDESRRRDRVRWARIGWVAVAVALVSALVTATSVITR